MAKPLIVSIPHNLGREEAKRRLAQGMTRLKAQFGETIASLEETWSEDRMDFRIGALGQTISGHLEVMNENVRVEVMLPWLLAIVADRARTFIEKEGALMLEKKDTPNKAT